MRPLLALGLILLTAAPASASTVPRVDFKEHQTNLAIGLYDLEVDHAIGKDLSLGLVTNVVSLAARATWRLGGKPDGPSWGFTLAGGPGLWPLFLGNPAPVSGYYDTPFQNPASWFVQPAFVWSTPLGAGWWVRGTLGPVLFGRYVLQGDYRAIENMFIPLWPNIELASRQSWGELTLGGGIVGARLSF